jgi:hypothetical protein
MICTTREGSLNPFRMKIDLSDGNLVKQHDSATSLSYYYVRTVATLCNVDEDLNRNESTAISEFPLILLGVIGEDHSYSVTESFWLISCVADFCTV